MRATVMYGAGDVRSEVVPDARLVEPTDADVRTLKVGDLAGEIEPGRVFDRVVRLDAVPDGYRAMNDREAINDLVEIS